MQFLTNDAFNELRAGSTVVEADFYGEKVLRLQDGSYLKLFRLKRLFSSALIWPYAKRFEQNCLQLKLLEINCPTVLNLYRVKHPTRHIVHYTPLTGITLRQLKSSPEQCPSKLFRDFGIFISQLHNKGVYFRSVHLGNVVLTPDNKFGLIDIADLKIHKRPLSNAARIRNFKHMLRYEKDKIWLKSNIFGSFKEGYFKDKNISRKEIEPFLDI